MNIDYKELLRKYIAIVEEREEFDMLGNAHNLRKDSGLSQEEYEELRRLSEDNP